MTESLRIFTEHVPVQRATSPAAPTTLPTLVLPFDQRQKARHRVRLSSGVEIGIHLPRGSVLRGGDLLRSDDGSEVEVVAAREDVSTVRSRDLRQLARVAYHLGNRHVALAIGTDWVRYLRDYVLDDMVRQLGLPVIHEREPFDPEAGAYGSHSHGGGHPHARDEHRTIFGGPWQCGHGQ